MVKRNRAQRRRTNANYSLCVSMSGRNGGGGKRQCERKRDAGRASYK